MHTVRRYDYHKAEIAWYLGGKLNACYNCVDRHVEAGRGGDTALTLGRQRSVREQGLTPTRSACRGAAGRDALRNLGIVKGDRVCIYMQMIPELVVAMLACARIGAIHSIVFALSRPTAS